MLPKVFIVGFGGDEIKNLSQKEFKRYELFRIRSKGRTRVKNSKRVRSGELRVSRLRKNQTVSVKHTLNYDYILIALSSKSSLEEKCELLGRFLSQYLFYKENQKAACDDTAFYNRVIREGGFRQYIEKLQDRIDKAESL